jgi:hypothetical protein
LTATRGAAPAGITASERLSESFGLCLPRLRRANLTRHLPGTILLLIPRHSYYGYFLPLYVPSIQRDGIPCLEGVKEPGDVVTVIHRLGVGFNPYKLETLAYSLAMAKRLMKAQERSISWQAEMKERWGGRLGVTPRARHPAPTPREIRSSVT